MRDGYLRGLLRRTPTAPLVTESVKSIPVPPAFAVSPVDAKERRTDLAAIRAAPGYYEGPEAADIADDTARRASDRRIRLPVCAPSPAGGESGDDLIYRQKSGNREDQPGRRRRHPPISDEEPLRPPGDGPRGCPFPAHGPEEHLVASRQGGLARRPRPRACRDLIGTARGAAIAPASRRRAPITSATRNRVRCS